MTSDPLAPPDRPERRPLAQALNVPSYADALEFAARMLDFKASTVPVGQESPERGSSTFNWLKYAARILRTEADVAVPARAHHEEKGDAMDPTMAPLIGGGLRPSYEDDSIRSWACGCYEDQGGYHFCSKRHEPLTALARSATPEVVPPAAVPDAGAPHTGKDSVMTLDVDPKRARLLTALATMPEEAFGWLVIALQPPGMPPHPSPWPDGLGGFMDASRAAITETHAAAKAYLEGDGQ